MTIVMAQQGWQCPKCGNIISPNMMWCPFCSGEKKVTYTTTTSTPYKVDTSRVCKTENSSEIPNNSTSSKMEQVDKDINVRSKTEPTTQTKTQNSNLTFEKADEPQTDCKTCKHKDLEGCEEPCLECKGYDLYEPQTERNE